MKWLTLLFLIFLATKIWAQTCTSVCTSTCTLPSPTPSPTPSVVVPPSACRVGQPLAPRATHRGMYVSIYNSPNVGAYTLPTNLQNILGNTVKENALLRFVINNSIDSLSYYDLYTILNNTKTTSALSAFISAARSCGVAENIAIGSELGDWDAIKAFGGFDGALTEIEFWNEPDVAGAFRSYLAQLQYSKSLGLKTYTYLGWLNRVPGQTETQIAAQIAPLVDRVLLHCYVKNGVTAYNYCASRINAFQAANPALPIMPIFSAESPTAAAGGEIFMGDWLRLNGMVAAETLFSQNFSKSVGFQYYEYAFLYAALGGK